MNETEARQTESSQAADLRDLYDSLSRQLTRLLVAVVVVSITLTTFLGLQVKRMGKDLTAARPQAKQVIDASVKEAPLVQSFAAKLVEYGKTHPDFQPIVTKYGLNTNSGAMPLGSKK